MKITIIHLPDVGCKETPYTKFILLSDGRLLYGKCLYHKELHARFFIEPLENVRTEERDTLTVIGAGKVPEDVHVSIEDDTWGNWESTGFDVITPLYLREPIRAAFVDHSTNRE